jgi:hypothetical protein
MKRVLLILGVTLGLTLGAATTAQASSWQPGQSNGAGFSLNYARGISVGGCSVGVWWHSPKTAVLQVTSSGCGGVTLQVFVEYKSCWCSSGTWFTAGGGRVAVNNPPLWLIKQASAPQIVCPGGWCDAAYAKVQLTPRGGTQHSYWFYPNTAVIGG